MKDRYLYFPRQAGVKSVRTEAVGSGLLVYYEAKGCHIGLEITAPIQVMPDQINAVLRRFKLSPLKPYELAPLQVA